MKRVMVHQIGEMADKLYDGGEQELCDMFGKILKIGRELAENQENERLNALESNGGVRVSRYEILETVYNDGDDKGWCVVEEEDRVDLYQLKVQMRYSNFYRFLMKFYEIKVGKGFHDYKIFYLEKKAQLVRGTYKLMGVVEAILEAKRNEGAAREASREVEEGESAGELHIELK